MDRGLRFEPAGKRAFGKQQGGTITVYQGNLLDKLRE
jgi:hypothetical protein